MFGNTENRLTTNSKDVGPEALRHMEPRPLRETTPAPTPSPTPKAATTSRDAAVKPGGTVSARKPAKRKARYFWLLLLIGGALLALTWLPVGQELKATITEWAGDVMAGPEERTWRRARREGFDAIEKWLRSHEQSEFSEEAKEELVRSAGSLAKLPEARTFLSTTGVNARVAPSREAAIVFAYPKGATVKPLASVRSGTWLVIPWQGKEIYAASSQFIEKPARRRRFSKRARRVSAGPVARSLVQADMPEQASIWQRMDANAPAGFGRRKGMS